MKNSLKITTCQAANTFALTDALASHISSKLAIPTQFVDNLDWSERYRQLATGEIQMAWICGWPYVHWQDKPHAIEPGALELLAAPVMQWPRYTNRALYFADVVTPTNSQYHHFAELAKSRWVYNDSGSLSGYHSVRHHLALNGLSANGEPANFFDVILASGGHALSLQMLLDGQADSAAIDSTFLDWLWAQQPHLREKLRRIHSVGPFPAPPLVIQRSLPAEMRQRVRHLLLTLHQTETGRALLQLGNVARFMPMADDDYDLVRRISQTLYAQKTAAGLQGFQIWTRFT